MERGPGQQARDPVAASGGHDERRRHGAFVASHNRAIDAFEGRDYRVFCDIRKLAPLSPEAAQRFEAAKSYSAKNEGFQGSAVLVEGKIVALQHQRTSVASGVMPTELISESEAPCMAHLASVRRTPAPAG